MKDILLKKSNNNSVAADLLVKEEHFCSSVHCAYYSSYQLMVHIILNVLGIDSVDYKNDVNNNMSSHNITFNKIRSELIKRNNAIVTEFSDNYRKLKKNRINADYYEILILERDCSNSISASNSINSRLKNIFLQ